jgi:hypothetical protein
MSYLSIPFLYPSEINSSRMRNFGNATAMITNWVFVYVVVIMTPSGKSLLLPNTYTSSSAPKNTILSNNVNVPISTAIANIAWKFYIIFAVLNFAWFPIVWFFYVETKGLSLEEVDLMFKFKYHGGKGMTYKEAAELAKAEIDSVRRQETEMEKETAKVEETEFAGSYES